MAVSVSCARAGVARASTTTTPRSPTMKPVLGSPPVISAYTPSARGSTCAGSGAETGAFGFSSPESAMRIPFLAKYKIIGANVFDDHCSILEYPWYPQGAPGRVTVRLRPGAYSWSQYQTAR